MAHELDEQVALAGTDDPREGVLAMLEGRAPVFRGQDPAAPSRERDARD